MATPIPGNQCEFTLAEAAAITGGRLHGDASISTRSVSIDTRTIAPGALFVALRGASGDGHDYLEQAALRGAAAAIVETGMTHAGIPCIEVADTLVALGQLARLHLTRIRDMHPLPTIAIGGAAGKTSTKELTAAAAGAVFGHTLSTPGNLNNRIGVPMTIFTLTDNHRAAVLECGTNLRGEIARLAAIVEPDATLVLNVDLEHTEGLGTLDDVADEEAALFSTARRFAVTSSEEPLVLARIPSHLDRITFGKSPASDVRLDRRTFGADGRARVRVALSPSLCGDADPNLDFDIGLLGETAALNCTAAIAGVAAMRGEPLAAHELRAIADALATVQPVAGRLATISIRGIHVIDDTYNSNPRSIRAALAAAREVADGLGARLVIAMGDMLELGALSLDAHVASVRDVMRAQAAAFVAVGPEMRAAVATIARSAPAANIITVPDSVAAGTLIASIVRPGDVLLLKGSRGMAMERILDSLRP